MNDLHQVLLENNYPDWIIKEPEKKPPTPIRNLETGLELKKNILMYVLYVPGLSKEFRRIFHHTNVQVNFKGYQHSKIHRFCPGKSCSQSTLVSPADI